MKQNETYTTKIVDSIIQGIIDGTYKPGAIITEKELIEKHGVSRSPVREALMKLSANQVLEIIPRYGSKILPVSRESMYEMMEYRYYLESQSLRKSIDFITPKDISELEALDERTKEDIVKEHDYPIIAHWRNNMAFHLLLVSFARNNYVHKEMEKTMNNQLRGYAQFFSEHDVDQSGALSTTSHLQIIEALKQKDVEGAIEGLRRDLSKINLTSQHFTL